jgi:FkbM family methyltransferase
MGFSARKLCRNFSHWRLLALLLVVGVFLRPQLILKPEVPHVSATGLFEEVGLGVQTDFRQRIIEHVNTQRQQNLKYSVIDIGGSADGWSGSIVDALVDINPPANDRSITYFKINLGEPTSWTGLLNYVSTHGKFDFCICSHTLEDIANPRNVVSLINQISKSGFIATPSKYIELRRFEGVKKLMEPRTPGVHLGYIHHRWIYTFRNNVWLALPKLNFLDFDPYFESLTDEKRSSMCGELRFLWKGSIELKLLNNDYMGPNPDAVADMYTSTLTRDDLDPICHVITGGSMNELHACKVVTEHNSLSSTLMFLKNEMYFIPKNILDVGANEGLWTTHVKTIFPAANFFMYEANEMHEAKLKATGVPYKLQVLGEKRGNVTWYINEDAHTGSSMMKERTSHYSESNQKLHVTQKAVSTLDEEVGTVEYQVLKLDVQGSELLVLEGAQKMLKTVDLLVLETSVVQYNVGSPLTLDVIVYLHRHNFQLFAIPEVHIMQGNGGSFQLQVDLMAVRESSALAKQLISRYQDRLCEGLNFRLDTLTLFKDFDHIPESVSCESPSCKLWDQSTLKTLLPDSTIVDSRGELVVISIFPLQDAFRVLSRYADEYNLLLVGDILTQDSMQVRMDVLLIKKTSNIFEKMTSGWLATKR